MALPLFFYGSVEGVKDNLPRAAKYIRPDAQVTSELDIKQSTVEDYLKEFTAQVNAALSIQYRVPFEKDTVPAVLDTIVNNLAAYKLARRFYTNVSNEENYSISALRKDAKEMLDAIVDGSYVLPGVVRIGQSGDELDEILGGIEADDQGEVFTMGDPSEWQARL